MLSWLVSKRKMKNVRCSALACENREQDTVLLFFYLASRLISKIHPCRLVLTLSSVSESCVCLASAPSLSGQTLYLSIVPLGVLGAAQALGGAQQQWPAFPPASPQSDLKGSFSLEVALLECQRPSSSAHFCHVRRTSKLHLHASVDLFSLLTKGILSNPSLWGGMCLLPTSMRRKTPEKKFDLEYIT